MPLSALLLAATLATAPTQMPPAPAFLVDCLQASSFAGDVDALRRERAQMDGAAWASACAEARAADRRRLAVSAELVRTGVSPQGAFPASAELLTLSRAAKNPDLKALYLHAAAAELPREALPVNGKTSYATALPPLAAKLLAGRASADAVEADTSNRAWLGATIARRGWFSIKRDGADADQAAWLIVEHGDGDPAFQLHMIAVLEPLVATGDTTAQGFSAFYDRSAAEAGRPGRYGLQGWCSAPGVWTARPVEAPGELDARRRVAGLGPMAAFQASQSAQCASAEKPWWAAYASPSRAQ